MHSAIQTLTRSSESYPSLLKEFSGAPERLYAKGTVPAPRMPLVAIVGTRKATPEGVTLAKHVARECARKGLGVVSGLAFGIDAAAHEGALAGEGYTAAVLANGLDTVYPREHEHLAERMLEAGGTLFSEYTEGTPAYPGQFLERNRIIAGLCMATVVVEAPARSGAIATARNAAEGGREVFVFPGSVSHRNYRGSHTLIRNGARLVADTDELFEDLNLSSFHAMLPLAFVNKTEQGEPHNAAHTGDHAPEATLILATLRKSATPLAVDNIIELTTLEPKIVSRHLSFLVLSGAVEEIRGKFMIRK